MNLLSRAESLSVLRFFLKNVLFVGPLWSAGRTYGGPKPH